MCLKLIIYMEQTKIETLAKALDNLKKSLAFLNKILIKHSDKLELFELVTASASMLHHVEIAFDFAIKVIKSVIDKDTTINVPIYSTKDLLKVAETSRLINSHNHWIDFYNARVNCSKIYDNDDEIMEIYQSIKMFVIYLESLIYKLEKLVVVEE